MLETTINGASDVIVNISGDISLMDANDAVSYVQDLAGEDTNIIFGALYDDTAVDTARITVIATGLNDATAKQGSVSSGAKSMFNIPKSKPQAQVQQEQPKPAYTQGFTMPTLQIPPAQSAPTTSTVPKKDIQIPDFLKNRK